VGDVYPLEDMRSQIRPNNNIVKANGVANTLLFEKNRKPRLLEEYIGEDPIAVEDPHQ
jgi:hypothetical protein